MPYGLYISAEGAMAQGKRLETIANNLANVDTAGFKRDLALFQARFAEETQRALDYHGSGSINDLGGGVLVESTHTDFSQGPLQRTGVETDMAIVGEGFFVVRKGEQDLLTRAGNLQFNAAGELVTAEGHAVLSDSGATISVDPELGPWRLTTDGAIEQGGAATPLAIVRPASLADLAKLGENLFLPLAETSAIPAEQRQVRGGYLERSTIKPTTAMMELIETSRAFEANVTLIRNQDEMLGGLVNRLLRTA